jgi:hypothetical protein
MAWASYCLTEVLRLTSPHLAMWQRWIVVLWLWATCGALDMAWRVGG